VIKLKVDKSLIEVDNYLDTCIICLNLLDYINDQENNGTVTPDEILKKIVRAKSEMHNLSLLDKQQILKDNDNLILWS
jgi:hypothetical protein